MHCEHLSVNVMVLFVLFLSASRQMMGNANKAWLYEVHTPINALYIKFDKVLKFILKSL